MTPLPTEKVLEELIHWLLDEIDSAELNEEYFAKRAHQATEPRDAGWLRAEADNAGHRAGVLKEVLETYRAKRLRALRAERQGRGQSMAKVLRFVPPNRAGDEAD